MTDIAEGKAPDWRGSRVNGSRFRLDDLGRRSREDLGTLREPLDFELWVHLSGFLRSAR